MIITTSDTKIATASVVSVPIGLEVIVNTDKRMVLSLQGSECNTDTGLTSYFWIFSNQNQPEIEVTIELTSENADEEAFLKSIEFTNYERGQFCFLLISPTLLTNRTLLAATDIPENNNAL